MKQHDVEVGLLKDQNERSAMFVDLANGSFFQVVENLVGWLHSTTLSERLGFSVEETHGRRRQEDQYVAQKTLAFLISLLGKVSQWSFSSWRKSDLS